MSTTTVSRTGLRVGQQVKLAHGTKSDAVRWWTVRAVDDRFVILTRQREFAAKGKLLYTVIDWERGERGPCDLVLGTPWDMAEDDSSDKMLEALRRHAAGDHSSGYSTEVSHRNSVPAEIVGVRT